MTLFWGKQLIINLAGCTSSKIRCRTNIKDFAKHLVSEIEGEKSGDSFVTHFGKGDKQGFTLVKLVEASNLKHITGHFCEKSNQAYIDLFSCKDFDQFKVKNLAWLYFQPKKASIRTYLRSGPSLY